MAPSLQDLIDHLLAEIALCGDQGMCVRLVSLICCNVSTVVVPSVPAYGTNIYIYGLPNKTVYHRHLHCIIIATPSFLSYISFQHNGHFSPIDHLYID